MKKISACIAFYKSTLIINVPLSILFGIIVSTGGEEFNIILLIKYTLMTFCTFGLIVDLVYKDLARKDEYLFYYNLSVPKYVLILSTFLLNYLLYILFCQLAKV